MIRAGERAAREPPWARAEVAGNRVSSADWECDHPALCYEFGDPIGAPFIPPEVVVATLRQQRLVIALWQFTAITLVDMQHNPTRTCVVGPIREYERPPKNWCDVTRFDVLRRQEWDETSGEHRLVSHGHRFGDKKENLDPRVVLKPLLAALETTLGCVPQPPQSLLLQDQPLLRVVIEFPGEVEDGEYALDTSVSSLAELSREEYLNIVAGRTEV